LAYISVDYEGLWTVEKVADELPPFEEIVWLRFEEFGDYALVVKAGTLFAEIQELVVLRKVCVRKDQKIILE
jgi:hypothetical protein